MNNKETLFYKDKPIFGFDIGHSSLKVMQINSTGKKHTISAYGTIAFDPESIKDGVIVNPTKIAESAYELFSNRLVGDITTNRAIFSVPASHCYSRTVQLPLLGSKELFDAVQLEVEQYVPIANDKLYIDYSKLSETDGEAEIIIVAVPKTIIDSYLILAKILNLEVAGIQTSITASGRLFLATEEAKSPTVLIDFGSLSSDLTIYDNGLVITSTISSGGDNITEKIASTLDVTNREAHIIKTKYGLNVSKKQQQIQNGLSPILQQMIKEIRRMIRYYEERNTSNGKISQIITMGGGANMPGLSNYIIDSLRLPVRMCEPWEKVKFGSLQPPNSIEKAMYITVAGLALTTPRELT